MKYSVTTESGTVLEVNSSSTLAAMRAAVPQFFAKPHGKRETYDVYRGCLIVRHTVQFSDKEERRIVAYLFLPKGSPDTPYPNTFCISAGTDIRSLANAKRLIDLALDGGRYVYGMTWRKDWLVGSRLVAR